MGELLVLLNFDVLSASAHEECVLSSPSMNIKYDLKKGKKGYDWAGDIYDWKSTVGYVFNLGLGPVTWACKSNLSFLFLRPRQSIE
uniref:Uncharacterized protein n=1 Tax=Picea glauca TaxID=3330 RepID=A0A124GMT2_PICGL|nr:hypothetical protein ABT39_MTgene1353 [Picea glauca]QHR89493.1 hypothetical protein Q903MT_gene3514 [Picea sitchensis]